jgi:putative transcriptional regulator
MATQDSKPNEGKSFLEGKLLIAMPGMPDPRFAHTVIYICAHSAKGAMGIVINKPIPGLTFIDLMEQLEIPLSERAADLPVLYGGPMETGRGFVLHTDDYESAEATLPVSEEISLTATVDILRAMADGRGPKKAVFALGYAGWAPGQIESEFQGNGWLHCEADPDLVFDPDLDAKWRTALARLGVGPSGLVSDAGRA